MAKIVSRNCPHCGAALQVNPAAQQPYNATCSFCRTVVMIVPFASQRATPGGPPPPQAGPNVILLDEKSEKAAATGAGCMVAIIVASVALPVVLGVVGAVGAPIGSYLNSRFNPWLFPLECGPADEIVIRGRSESRTDPFIKGNASCKIRIVDSKLTGPVIVKGGTNVNLVVENSTLRVTRAVVEAGSNSTVTLEQGSKVYTDGYVASGEVHVRVELTASTIESKGGVVKGQNGAEVRATEKSQITSAKPVVEGIHAKVNLDDSTLLIGSSVAKDGSTHFRISASNGSTIRSERVPVLGGTHGEVEISRSRLEGKMGAVDVGMHCKVNVQDGAVVTSPVDTVRMGTHSTVEVGENAKIEARKTAIRVGSHSTIRVRGGSVTGVEAIAAEDYANITLQRASITGTRTTGSRSNIREE